VLKPLYSVLTLFSPGRRGQGDEAKKSMVNTNKMNKLKYISGFISITVLIILFLAFRTSPDFKKETIKLLKKEIITRADNVLNESPQTVTMYTCKRSAGGIHDFYSEGDYWWPGPANPDGPYIQRDGMNAKNNHGTCWVMQMV